MMHGNVTCPECGGESLVDPDDADGLTYDCSQCSHHFKITYDDLYGSVFNKPLVELPQEGEGRDGSSLFLSPLVHRRKKRVSSYRINTFIPEKPSERVEVEPAWIATDESWIRFKQACRTVGIDDPWTIVHDDGDVDFATIYLNANNSLAENFPKVMEKYLPYKEFVVLKKKIQKMMQK